MEIIFFLGRRQLENYTFSKIKNRKKYQLIAIVFEHEVAMLSPEGKAHFDLVHGLKGRTEGFLAEFNPKTVLKVMKEDIDRIKPTRVSLVCQDEANVIVAGELREALNITTGARTAELNVFKNKIDMKKALGRHHIRVPHYQHYDKAYTYAELSQKMGIPFILKPSSSSGSLGVYKITSPSEYDRFLKEQKGNFDDYEIEEFIDGVLYECDLVAKDKEILFVELSEYTCPNLEFQSGKALGSMGIPHESEIYQKMAPFAKKALSALGMPDGCHHMEIFLNGKNEMIFLEVAARAPGFLVPKMHEKTSGVSLLDLDLWVQADVEFVKEDRAPVGCVWAIFPIREGKIKELIPLKLESQFEMKWLVKPGQVTGPCVSNGDMGASMFATNPDFKAIERDFRKIAKHVAIVY